MQVRLGWWLKKKTVRDHHGYFVKLSTRKKRRMPHRATYFFPRQFPEKRFDESSKSSTLDHENKKSPVKSTDTTFCIENDLPKSSNTPTKDNLAKNSAVSELGKKFRNEQKQIAAFCDWLVDKRHSHHHHRRRHHQHQHQHHHHRHRSDHILHEDDEEDRELLLPDSAKVSSPDKDVVDVDRRFEREASLSRLSSGSSYATSLFASDVTVTATFSSDDITKEDTSSFRVSTNEVTRRNKQEEEEEHHEEEKLNDQKNYAKECKESYELQTALAKRLSFLSTFGSEPVLTFDTGLETWDVESVSRRLWVRYLNHVCVCLCIFTACLISRCILSESM